MSTLYQLSEPPDGDHDRAGELNAFAWTWCALASIFVTLRVYSRTRLTNNMWWDDWFIIITLVLAIVTTALWTYLGQLGGCRHLYYLQQDPAQAVQAMRINWLAQPFMIMALATGKISVAFLILRIMRKSIWRRGFLVYGAMIGSFVFCSIAVILTFAQCRPVSALWDPRLLVKGEAKCWPPRRQANFSVFAGTWLAFTDLAMALIPITIIAELQLSMRRKIGICFLMGLGVFACICGAFKTSKLLKLTARSDLTYLTVDLWIWNANESYITIMAACAPTFPPIWRIGSAYVTGSKKSQYTSTTRTTNTKHNITSQRKVLTDNTDSSSRRREPNEVWLELGPDQRFYGGSESDIRRTVSVDVSTYAKREKKGRRDKSLPRIPADYAV